MNQVLHAAVSGVLLLVLAGTGLVSPVRGQERSRGSRTAAPVPGLIREALRDDAVRKEMGLTDDQVEKLRKISEETDFFGRLGPMFQKLRTAETDDDRLKLREELRVLSESLSLEQDAKVKQVVDETQFRRGTQISLQRQGARALMRPDVTRDLGITQAQADELKRLAQDFSASGFQSPFASATEDGRKAQKEFEARMLGVLTEEQKAKWTEMLGLPGPPAPDPGPVFGSSGFGSSGFAPGSSRGNPEASSRSVRGGTGSQVAGFQIPLPTSYGMIDDESIAGQIQFIAALEVHAARGRTLSLNRDQVQLLTNLQARIQFDQRLNSLRQRLTEARTFAECAAVRTESCCALEEWNAEIETELRMIVGDQEFARLRPAILKRQGLWALTRSDVAAELKLSDEQREQLKEILNDYRTAAAEAPVDAARPERSRLAAPFEQKMLEVLTVEQRTQWKAATER